MTKQRRFTRSEITAFLLVAKRIARFPELDCIAAPAHKGQGRLLIITPKRIGTAPERNTVRRRLKAVFQSEHLYECGYDYGIIVKKAGANTSSARLKEIFATIASKAPHAPTKAPSLS